MNAAFDTLQQLHWQWPWAAPLAALPWLAARRGRRPRLEEYAEAHLRPWAMERAPAPLGRRLARAAETLALLLLAVALAGPALPAGTAAAPAGGERSRLHLTVVVQVSDSMRAADLAPDRLGRARLSLQDSLARLRGESLSLVAYGAQAGLLLPASRDRALFRAALRWLDAEVLPGGGSHLGHALAVALAQPAAPGRHAVVLVTDGDAAGLRGDSGAAVQAALARMRRYEVPLYVLLALPEGSDAPSYAELARRAGGRLARITDPGQGWEGIYERGIARLSLPAGPAERLRSGRQLFVYPLAAAILLLLFAHTPGAGRRLPLAACLALVLAAPVPAGAETPQERAWAAYAERRWEEAARLYAGLGGHAGERGAGVAALHAGRPGEALQHLSLAWMLAGDDGERLDALYNLGHAHAALGRWEAALQAWLAVLAERPDDREAAINAAVARRELEKRRRGGEALAARPGRPEAGAGEAAAGMAAPGGEPSAGAAARPRTAPADAPPAPSFRLQPRHLEAGRVKVERLVEQDLALQKGMLRQDQAAGPWPPPGP